MTQAYRDWFRPPLQLTVLGEDPEAYRVRGRGRGRARGRGLMIEICWDPPEMPPIPPGQGDVPMQDQQQDLPVPPP